MTDTGAGIKPEDLPRLFREFVQLETTRARHHEGTGSTFTVVLPVSGPPGD